MEDNDNNGRQKEQSKIEITVEHSGVRVSVTTTNQMFKTSYFQNSYRVKGILEACLVNALGQI